MTRAWILSSLFLAVCSVSLAQSTCDRSPENCACDERASDCAEALQSIGCNCVADRDMKFRTACCPTSCCKYWSFFGGANWNENYVGEVEQPPINQVPQPPFIRNGSYQDGFLVGVAHGRCITSNLRHEFEFTYRRNEADWWTAAPAGAQRVQANWDGALNVYAGMTNLVYDFGNRSCRRITPYAGSGIGIAFLDGNFRTATDVQSVDDEAFAYQGFGGLKTCIRNNIYLLTEYRFFGTTAVGLTSAGINNNSAGSDPYHAHGFLVGLQFRR